VGCAFCSVVGYCVPLLEVTLVGLFSLCLDLVVRLYGGFNCFLYVAFVILGLAFICFIEMASWWVVFVWVLGVICPFCIFCNNDGRCWSGGDEVGAYRLRLEAHVAWCSATNISLLSPCNGVRYAIHGEGVVPIVTFLGVTPGVTHLRGPINV